MKARELKEKIKNKEITVGYQQFIPSPQITEIGGHAGFDWLWFCLEHGTAGYGAEMENCIRAAEAVGIVPIVRITDPAASFLYMRVLEAGAKGVIVPRVKNKDDVRRAVEEVKFPPHGIHGLCPFSRRWEYGLTCREENDDDYLTHAEEESFVIPIIESRQAVENIDEILSVEGVDFVVWGAVDLAVDMGLLGRKGVKPGKRMQVIEDARRQVLAACDRRGIPLCQVVQNSDLEVADQLIKEGCYMLVSAPDIVMLMNACRKLANVKDK